MSRIGWKTAALVMAAAMGIAFSATAEEAVSRDVSAVTWGDVAPAGATAPLVKVRDAHHGGERAYDDVDEDWRRHGRHRDYGRGGRNHRGDRHWRRDDRRAGRHDRRWRDDRRRHHGRRHRDRDDHWGPLIFGLLLAQPLIEGALNQPNYPPAPPAPRAPGRGYGDACGYWHEQCVRNWGYRNPDYRGCMRYYRCN